MDRKPILLGLLLLTGLGFGGDALYRQWVEAPFAKQAETKASLEKQRSEIQTQLLKAKKSVQNLAEIEDRSLPAKTDFARQGYQSWWWQLVTKHRIINPSVDVSQAKARFLSKKPEKNSPPDIHEFVVTVRGNATLNQTTQLLSEFYSTDLLHQIESINLTPINGGQAVNFSITAVAMSLRSATELENLPGQILANDHLLVSASAQTQTNPADSPMPPPVNALLDPTIAAAENTKVLESGADDALTKVQTVDLASETQPAPNDPVNPVADPQTSEANTDASPANVTLPTAAVNEKPWDQIVKRNVFAAGGGMKIAAGITLSAITQDSTGTKQAWFRVANPARTQIIDQGQTFQQGVLAAKVLRLEDDLAIIQIEGSNCRVRIGQSLADGIALIE